MGKNKKKKSARGVVKIKSKKNVNTEVKAVSNSVSMNTILNLFSSLIRFIPKESVYSAANTFLDFLRHTF
ncbi:hypothetical protein EV144_101327 [Flavobacterium sp. 270]|nr:hypothetical protein EV144_101327 [Flavobacterium sp. 270]